MNQVIVPYCTEGFMKPSEVFQECGKQGWVPLVVFDHEGFTVIPTFSSESICNEFLKRNFPKDWVKGGVSMTSENLIKMEQLGWRALELSFPRKMKDIVVFRTEIFELVGDFEARVQSPPR